MVYISADGSIHARPPPSRNPIKVATTSVASISPRVAIGVAAIAAAVLRSGIVGHYFGPLANGAIPAAKMTPGEHWGYMANNDMFVRSMTEPLSSFFGRTRATKEGKRFVREHNTARFLDRADFGGPDGHVAQDNFMDDEGVRVTRCSTTSSGITAFYCGSEVATNMDVARGYGRKMTNFGTESFRQYLLCRREKGVQSGHHQRSVYRLGVGCKDNLAGMSHAFSIVAQPDGTYYWLQSYISQYSLATWMKKTDGTKESGLAGQLTYDELLKKLDLLDRLMDIDNWTAAANEYYLDLFNVDKGEIIEWKDDHRLAAFSWDEACEYPLPDGYLAEGHYDHNATADDSLTDDECSALLSQISLFGILEMLDIEKQ